MWFIFLRTLYSVTQCIQCLTALSDWACHCWYIYRTYKYNVYCIDSLAASLALFLPAADLIAGCATGNCPPQLPGADITQCVPYYLYLRAVVFQWPPLSVRNISLPAQHCLRQQMTDWASPYTLGVELQSLRVTNKSGFHDFLYLAINVNGMYNLSVIKNHDPFVSLDNWSFRPTALYTTTICVWKRICRVYRIYIIKDVLFVSPDGQDTPFQVAKLCITDV